MLDYGALAELTEDDIDIVDDGPHGYWMEITDQNALVVATVPLGSHTVSADERDAAELAKVVLDAIAKWAKERVPVTKGH